MPLKKRITDRAVKELYQVMATEHFARLSNVTVRLLNDWQRTKAVPEEEVRILQARIRALEEKAGRLETKLAFFEQILSRQTLGSAPGRNQCQDAMVVEHDPVSPGRGRWLSRNRP